MRIGIPRERKPMEGRVALVPEACGDLVRDGHEVLVESGAGEASGYADAAYEAAGARLVPDAAALYDAAELVVKVKEPVEEDLRHLRRGHLLFCFLHLAAMPELAGRLRAIGLTALGFETVAVDGRLPLLAPMSQVAGRIAVQVGATLLHLPQGGRGLLLGGLPGTERGHVVVLGAGTVGSAATAMAAATGALVTVFDRKPERLEAMRALGPNVTALYPYRDAVAAAVREADLLVGAVLVPARRTPHLVSEAMVRAMRPGSVIADVSVDQGGCVETTRPTTWERPTYVEHAVVHFAVTNMPGAVPRSATQALSAALLPWVRRLARPDWREDPALAGAVNVAGGEIVHPALREELAAAPAAAGSA